MATMRAFCLPSGYGKPSGYKLLEVPKPAVTDPKQVLVKVHAASLNPIDMRFASGTMRTMMPTQSFPAKLGFDASGVIEEMGVVALSSGFKVGDEVFVRVADDQRGTLCEYALTTYDFLAKKPSNVSHVEAASIPLVSLTGYQVFGRFSGGREALAGKRVLVTGGMGGAGSVGVQIAKAFGAGEVITAVSTPKLPRAREIFNGIVDTFIDYKTTPITSAVQPRSLDFIYDTAGVDVTSLFPLLKEDHHVISIAALPSGNDLKSQMPVIPWYVSTPLNLLAKFKLEGPAARAGVHYHYHIMTPNGADLEEIGKLVEQGKIKPVIGDVFDFTEEGCRTACELVTGNGSKNGGKCVIRIV